MNTPTQEQLDRLVKAYELQHKALADYMQDQFFSMTADERNACQRQKAQLLEAANQLRQQGMLCAMADSAAQIADIESASSAMAKALSQLASFQKVINITGCSLAVAGAVLTRKPDEIAGSISSLWHAIRA